MHLCLQTLLPHMLLHMSLPQGHAYCASSVTMYAVMSAHSSDSMMYYILSRPGYHMYYCFPNYSNGRLDRYLKRILQFRHYTSTNPAPSCCINLTLNLLKLNHIYIIDNCGYMLSLQKNVLFILPRVYQVFQVH